MNVLDPNLSYLFLFTQFLNDSTTLKKHMEHYKQSMGLTDFKPNYASQALVVLPYFPPDSLRVNSVMALANRYNNQAAELASFLYLELGFTPQQIHIESGSMERLIKQYIRQYQIDKVVMDWPNVKSSVFTEAFKSQTHFLKNRASSEFYKEAV